MNAWTKYPSAKPALVAWHSEVKAAEWTTPDEVRLRYPTASIVGDERVVFNIKGNTYRLVVAINYALRIVFIKFFGTHAEYDKIDVREVRHDD